MTKSSSFTFHKSFDESLIKKYDGFILDQFGVLHNGTNGLDGAPQLVEALATKYKKKLVILSNSSSSSEGCKMKLPQYGFDQTYFVNAVTSGEEAGRYIRNKYGKAEAKAANNSNDCGDENNDNNSINDTNENQRSNKKALWITWKSPKSPSPLKFLELCGGNIQITTDPKEADFVILHGVDVIRGPGDDGVAEEISLGDFHSCGFCEENKETDNAKTKSTTMESVLRSCVEHHLPAICANPDYIMVRPDSSKGYMPGTIAKRYQELGGICTSFGKPHVSHFEACLRDLGLPKHKVAHVGDSLHHDVAGANNAGISSIFVVGGIHRSEIDCKLGENPDRDTAQRLFDKHSQIPTHVIPMFRE